MKMKKYLSLGLSTLAIIAIVGCSHEANKGKDIPKNNVSNNENMEGENTEGITLLGKVKKIIGNEIEIELAKNQDVSGNDLGSLEGVQFHESVVGDSDAPPKPFIPPTEGSNEAYASSNPTEGGEGLDLTEPGDDEKIELEYTGETVKITIPTGAKIFDMRSGSDSKLSTIKTNSIIQIFAKGTKEDPIVKSIDIVE